MGDDLISRQVAIYALEKKKDKKSQGDISGFYNKIIQNDIDTLILLPSANRPQGKWIVRFPYEDTGKIRTCSNCNITQTVNIYDGVVRFKFCPYCGAMMKGTDE